MVTVMKNGTSNCMRKNETAEEVNKFFDSSGHSTGCTIFRIRYKVTHNSIMSACYEEIFTAKKRELCCGQCQ